jgi:hypothetical protein
MGYGHLDTPWDRTWRHCLQGADNACRQLCICPFTPTNLLQQLLQSFQELLSLLSLLLHPRQAVASQQRQLLCQQLGRWCHNVPLRRLLLLLFLLLLLPLPRLLLPPLLLLLL